LFKECKSTYVQETIPPIFAFQECD